ncbi:hypothetical protein, partial [Peribacillus muralis]|uniref:hypothetical protein n=1 Tax=Peribacillus muralis TaxID=264697 RepID=UPI001F42EED5
WPNSRIKSPNSRIKPQNLREKHIKTHFTSNMTNKARNFSFLGGIVCIKKENKGEGVMYK